MISALISASIFSPSQLTVIIAVAVVAFLLIVGNIILYFLLRRKQERKLCTTRLQAKRNELLDHLRNIRNDGTLIAGGAIYSDVEEDEEEQTDDVESEEDDDDDEKESVVITETLGEDEDITANEILAVADMSEYTRKKLGFVGDEYDRKRYYVRYRYGFEAKLRAASDEVKERYVALVNEVCMYKGVKLRMSFRAQRIYKGRKTLGLIFMRGKTLCVALALDPKAYEDTKYQGIDKSDQKRFADTPMMYKLTSMRRTDYARYLFMQLCDLNLILPDESKLEPDPIDLSSRTPDELFVAQALRIAILGPAPDLEYEAEPEITFEDVSDEPVSEEEAQAEAEPDVDEEQDEMAIETPEGRIVFDRSFTARITQSDDALKARYSELKNYILSYKGVRSRISWKRETFSLGRKTMATFAVRGKTLMLYLASDPEQFADTKYHVENMSEVASRRKTPLLFRVKSDRREMYAKQLVDMLFAENGVQRTDRKPQDYTVPYKSTDALVKRGLIKIIQQQRGFGFNNEKKN